MQHKWRHWLTWRQGPQPPGARAQTHPVHSDVGNVSSQMPHRGKCVVANAAPAWHCPRCNVVSKRGVPCPRGVREPGGLAGQDQGGVAKRVRDPGGRTFAHVASRSQVASVKTWRHLPTRRQEPGALPDVASKQNVASLAHVASGSQVASPDVASKCGVTGPHGVRSQVVASKRGVTCLRGVREPGTCLRGVRQPRAAAGRPPEFRQRSREWPHLASQNVKMWRHLPTWRQGATWRRRTWRQNVASGAIDLRGVTGRGVKTWRHEARPPNTFFQNVSSVVGRYVHPHRRPPC